MHGNSVNNCNISQFILCCNLKILLRLQQNLYCIASIKYVNQFIACFHILLGGEKVYPSLFFFCRDSNNGSVHKLIV